MSKINPFVFFALGGLLLLPLLAAAQDKKAEKAIPDYSLNERKDVPVEYTWKIEDLFASLADWQAEKESMVKLIAGLETAARNWTTAPASMLALLDLINDIELKGSRLMSYASHQGNSDLGNTQFQAMEGEIRTIFVQMNSKLAFLQPDILALGAEKFSAYLQAEPKLSEYRFGIESILREKEHVLPGDQQRIASLTGLFAGVPGRASGMLNDVEAPNTEITLSDGKKVTLNQAAYVRLRASKNAADRTLVMKSFWENQKKFQNTLAILQDGAIKRHFFNAQIRNYPDCLAARLFGEDIAPAVYQQLIRSVHEYLPALQRYLALKQKMLGLPRFRYEDVYASAVQAVDKTFTFAEARKIIEAALKPLGKDYSAVLQQAFDNRWVDIYPNKGKQCGAYSGGVYGVHPFIKMNYNGDYDDVSTLAHELGHALHSYFSSESPAFRQLFVPDLSGGNSQHLQ